MEGLPHTTKDIIKQREHIEKLKVTTAGCTKDQTGAYLCWIQYLDAKKELQFDVVVMSREGPKWQLVSGLCKS